jgi:type II secretory pathway pseudopilin PulG
MTMRRANTGFVLIELVTTLVLVGVIGTFAAFFLYNGINGYLVSKRNSETALIAQAAMDRISAELRFVSALPVSATSDSITYFSNDFPTTPRRRLCYDSASKAVLLSVNAQPTLQPCGYGAENGRFLIRNVEAFQVTVTTSDMDNEDRDKNPATGTQEIATIRIGFTLTGISSGYSVEIHPRVLIAYP